MKPAVLLAILTLSLAAFGAQKDASPQEGDKAATATKTTQIAQNSGARPPIAPKVATTGTLESVLNKMDQTAASFNSAQADFEWDQYSKVVDEHDTQKGTIYFRKTGKGLEMAADISQPDKKYVLFSEGQVRVYQPAMKQVTVYSAGKNRAAFESFLVLGFGGRGHDLPKQFDVKYAGTESVGGVNAAKLELVPRQASVKNMFSLITLWIDPNSGISIQQKFLDEKSGDYRLAKYTNVKRNEKLQDSVFKLKTTSDTKTVAPQG